MKQEDLVVPYWVMCSDEDQMVVQDVTIGYDETFNLIILIERSDYEDHDNDCATWAVIDKNDAAELSRRLNVPMRELPKAMGQSMSNYSDIVNATLSQTKNCFHSILDCLTSYKCRYRIVRQPSADGFSCC